MIGNEIYKNTPPILFVDKQSAQAYLISGTGKPDIADQICTAFWALESSAGINVWVEYVPSKLNISDSPPRARNVPGGDNEITNSFESAPTPNTFSQRVLATFHLQKAMCGEHGRVSHGSATLFFNSERKTD